MNTRHLTQTALMTAIIILLGLFPPIPVGFIPTPIVMQNLGIILAGILLGGKRGTTAVVIFLLMAALGLPVLSGGRGGYALFLGPTGGYLLAYAFTPALIAFFLKYLNPGHQWWLSYIWVWVIGVGFIDFVGAIGMAVLGHIGLGNALVASVVFLPGDTIKAVVAVFLAQQLQRNHRLAELMQ